ncbi:MAG: ABC transporter ATP-binding protein [Clostridia bacterium]|nr:ABC transporter ATP-binding protein [Clostridia bacterium]
MIKINSVTKKYGNFTAIEKINIEVADTSIFALTGFNGSGKTTLLNICAGIVKADEGQVLLDGNDAFDNDVERKNLFYVSDNMYFPPTATVKSSAKFYASNYSNFDFELFKSILELFGISEKSSVKSLSKGMKKQVQLALGFATKPKYLLIDETFDGLDPHKKEVLKKLILEYISETNASIIIASHNLQEVSDICDHVAIINGKNVVLNCAIENISEKFRKVIVTFKNEISEQIFENVNYQRIKISGKTAMLTVCGDVEAEIEKIKAMNPESLESERLTLEEVFIEETEAESENEKIRSIFKK